MDTHYSFFWVQQYDVASEWSEIRSLRERDCHRCLESIKLYLNIWKNVMEDSQTQTGIHNTGVWNSYIALIAQVIRWIYKNIRKGCVSSSRCQNLCHIMCLLESKIQILLYRFKPHLLLSLPFFSGTLGQIFSDHNQQKERLQNG